MGAVLGGFCPAPYRLGGDELSGWRAAQHARVCADLAAASRSLPFAVLTIQRGGTSGDAPVAIRQNARTTELAVIAGNNPTPSISITWSKAPVDMTGEERTLQILGAVVYRSDGNGANSSWAITAPNQLTLVTDNASLPVTFSVKVFAQFGKLPSIEDYGGDRDKRDAEREVVPYAWIAYQDLESSLGSGFGAERSGSVHSRKLAASRALAACHRSEERLRANSRPDTADAMLDEWAKSLDVAIPAGESRARTRKFCSVLLAAESGESIGAVERACAHLLGDRFVGVRSFDIDDPASVWPASWDIGGGVWASTRCKFLVDVKPPLVAGDAEFKDLVEVRLMRLLDRIAPGHSWFNWTIPGDGFFLDVSPLDYTAL